MIELQRHLNHLPAHNGQPAAFVFAHGGRARGQTYGVQAVNLRRAVRQLAGCSHGCQPPAVRAAHPTLVHRLLM